jgi:predicted transcriptional regulator
VNLPELNEIKERRLRLKISQRELAKKMGVSQSSIAKIESGKTNPPYALVKRIVGYLEIARAASIGKVFEVASKPVIALEATDTVQKAVQVLHATGYKQLPVKEGEVWVGCIYERTISRHIVEKNDPRAVLARKVGEIMDEGLPTVTEDTPIPLVIPLLQHYQAVLAVKRGVVTGVVTNTDLLKLIQ